MQISPNSPSASRKLTLIIRSITVLFAVILLGLAWREQGLLQPDQSFSNYQIALLSFSFLLGLLSFTPITWNLIFLMMLVAGTLLLGVAELTLHKLLGPQFYGIYQLDEHVLYRLIPGSRRITQLPPENGNLRIQYSINSQGFRGEEPDVARKHPRLVVYGDSFIQGDFSPTPDTFTEQLKQQFKQKTQQDIEVLNAGVAGYGPDQELLRMEQELPTLKPDLVIVALYAGNDFGDLLRNKLFKLTANKELVSNDAVTLDPTFPQEMHRSQNEAVLRKMLRNVLNRMRGNPDQHYATGREARIQRIESNLKQAQDEYRQYIVEGDNVVHELYRDPYTADISLQPDAPSSRYRVALMEAILGKMQQVASKHQVPMLAVIIPSPIDVTDLHETGEIDAKRYPAYRASTLTDTLAGICKRQHIPAINLYEPFRHNKQLDLYLKGGDDHWNSRGQQLAAELVTTHLVNQKQFTTSPAEPHHAKH